MSVVGIDLGTTNTVVACVRGGRVHVLADEHGRKLLPSVVSFHPNGEVLVGHAAKERRVVDAKNTVFSVKRLIGRSFRTDEVQRARQRFAFELREGPGQGPIVVAREKEYSLPEISAIVLRRARQIAEVALGEPVERAVITVPANFNELQRAATKVAGRVAGLEVLRILNEPTAAALAYGLGKSDKERVAIYDFGGGTFDCTLLDLSGNVFEVLATAGDSFLGGDDLDNAIAERMADAFLLKHRYDPRTDNQAFERLRVAAEQLKIELSTQPSAQVRLREVAFGVGGAHLDLNFGLSRGELETISEPLVARTLAVTQDAFSLAGLSASSFSKVILVGGSTRIPLVASRVEGFFSQKPMDHLNPDEVVAIGAAIQAAALTDAARRRAVPPAPSPSGAPSARRVQTIPGVVRDRLPTIPPDDAPTEVGERPPVTKPSSAPAMRQANVPSNTVPLPMPATIPGAALPPTPAQTAQSAPIAPTPPAFAGSTTARMMSVPSTTARALVAPPPSAYEDATVDRPAPAGAQSLERDSSSMPTATDVHALKRAAASTETNDLHDFGQVAPLPPAMEPASSRPPPPPAPMPARGLSSRPPRGAPSSAPPAPILIDVTPHSLVVETVAGYCDTVIPRNARIPCDCTRSFTTVMDMQSLVRVRVAQGEDEVFTRNTFLGELALSGIRPAPRGEVTIQVTFELDANGTLRVQAADVATGRATHAVLQLIGIAEEAAIEEMTARHAAMNVRPGDA